MTTSSRFVGRRTQTKRCQQCGQPFEIRVVSTLPDLGQFCSNACAHAAVQKYPQDRVSCAGCGSLYVPDRRQARSLAVGRQKRGYCTSDCYRAHLPGSRRGASNPHWKGGRVKSNGYVYVREPRQPVSPYFAEHRKVAEAKHGRPLLPTEVVHHMNGDTTDNRPENLLVLTNSAHRRLHAAQDAARGAA